MYWVSNKTPSVSTEDLLQNCSLYHTSKKSNRSPSLQIVNVVKKVVPSETPCI